MKHLKLISLLFAALIFSQPPVVLAETESVEELNELLRGERSAVETYIQALEKLKTEPRADELRSALKNHQEAVTEISDQIQKLGGTPSTSSGAWGAWAATVTGSAKLLGDQTALKALREGEQHGLKEYQEILEEPVPSAFKENVRAKFLPRQQAHIAMLNRMSEAAS